MKDSTALHHNGDIAAAQATLEATRAAEHPHCLLCGSHNSSGFKLNLWVSAIGVVRGEFACRSAFQGYPKMLHGGMISAILDAAMTNCLFSLGVVAVTAELTIRYLSPVNLDCQVEVSGSLESSEVPLYHMTAEMKQAGHVVARAKAKFFKVGHACAAE